MTRQRTPPQKRMIYALAVICISPTFAAFMVMYGQIRVKSVVWCLRMAARNALRFILISETCITFT